MSALYGRYRRFSADSLQQLLCRLVLPIFSACLFGLGYYESARERLREDGLSQLVGMRRRGSDSALDSDDQCQQALDAANDFPLLVNRRQNNLLCF